MSWSCVEIFSVSSALSSQSDDRSYRQTVSVWRVTKNLENLCKLKGRAKAMWDFHFNILLKYHLLWQLWCDGLVERVDLVESTWNQLTRAKWWKHIQSCLKWLWNHICNRRHTGVKHVNKTNPPGYWWKTCSCVQWCQTVWTCRYLTR